MSHSSSQRLATWILTRCTADYGRESLIGDLIEQYETRGRWWYWRQVLGAIRTRSIRVLLAATETHLPAADFIADLIMCVALAIFCLMQLSICARLLLIWMGLIRSELMIIVVSPLIGVALITTTRLAHELQLRLDRGP